ncbi:MAG TPA: V-type ATP synthase subunit D, partial [Saprospiraceae bacterium]|nr:V-type ATP synthase subunit D [Saprospiraceae bacterium]
MAIKFQYNKTALQDLNKQLRVRRRAVPILKNKEAALRAEVKRARDHAQELDERLRTQMTDYEGIVRLWNEFDPALVSIAEVQLSVQKIAGIPTPVLEDIRFEVPEFSLFNKPYWFAQGIDILKKLSTLAIEREVFLRKMHLLDYARKKTTQKLNLYEKVQIPDYEDAILKIKRFLEDEENLSKSAQKIVKNRLEAMNE